jgi:aspartate dehydrogenase
MVIGVGIIGCGSIGTVLAHAIDEGRAGDTRLLVVYDSVQSQSEKLVTQLSNKPKIAKTFREFMKSDGVDLVVEAASQEAVKNYTSELLKAKKDLMIMSVGALVDEKLTKEVRQEAQRHGRKIYVPSGAVAGLDGMKAAVVGGIKQVILTTRKPPSGLKNAPYVKQRNIELKKLEKPTVIYTGHASEACRLFPANVNVAAALSLAGIGPNMTKVQIIADPTIRKNIHEIKINGEFGMLTVRAENVPFPNNLKTSYLAALSAVATLRKITEFLVVGT